MKLKKSLKINFTQVLGIITVDEMEGRRNGSRRIGK